MPVLLSCSAAKFSCTAWQAGQVNKHKRGFSCSACKQHRHVDATCKQYKQACAPHVIAHRTATNSKFNKHSKHLDTKTQQTSLHVLPSTNKMRATKHPKQETQHLHAAEQKTAAELQCAHARCCGQQSARPCRCLGFRVQANCSSMPLFKVSGVGFRESAGSCRRLWFTLQGLGYRV